MSVSPPIPLEDRLWVMPTVRLLLLALRPDCIEADELERAAAATTDWQAVAEAAEAHRVLPLVAKRLNACETLPPEARALLNRQAQQHALRSLRYTAELNRLIGALAEAGVTALPLKGPALAMLLYGDVALRQYADLDVLVPPADAGHAVRCVQGLGYRQVAPARPFRPEDLPAIQKLFGLKDLAYRHPERRIALELHWKVFKDTSHALDFAPRPSPGVPWPEPDPDVHALYILHHGSNHGYRRLCWLGDVAALVHHRTEIDWARVRALSERHGLQASVALGLVLADRLLGVPPPEAFVPVIERRARRLVRLADRCLTATPAYVEGGLERLSWMASLDDRPMARVRLAGSYLFKASAAEWNEGTVEAGAVTVATRPLALLRTWWRRRASHHPAPLADEPLGRQADDHEGEEPRQVE